MKSHRWNKVLVGLASLLAFTACEGYFGNKTDIDFLTPPDFSQRPAFYVPVQPVISGFIAPTDVLSGFDELIYVVDNGQERIFSYDQSGVLLGSLAIPGVEKVVQDRKLDLLAIGTADTTINGTTVTLSAIYRINIKQGVTINLSAGKITNKIIHPFYFKNSFSSNDLNTKITDVAIWGDNQYYITRNGDFQGSSSLPPDDAVLIFSNQDVYMGPVVVSSQGGSSSDFFKKPSSLISFMQPPQISAQNFSRNFIYLSTENTAENPYRVRGIEFTETVNGASYSPAAPVAEDTSKADGFLTSPYRFQNPTGIALAGDGSNYIFVVDAASDSLYQFTFNGLEGVPPPPGSAQNKNITVSFGGLGSGLTQFNNPSAVAYANEVVYVADKGNGRVLRYRLTTDFED